MGFEAQDAANRGVLLDRSWLRDRLLTRWTRVDQDSGRRGVDVNLERGLLFLALALFASGLMAALAASFGAFRFVAPLILTAWLVAAGGIAWLAFNRRLWVHGDWYDAAALALAALIGLSAGALHHDYVLGTFDSGFYFEDAWVISQTGGRTIHGPYDEVTPGYVPAGEAGVYEPFWSIGYPAFAAILGFFAGIQGIFWANAPLLFVAGLALYQVGRGFGAKIGGLLVLVFWGGSHLTVWLGRWLLTEALVAAILWTAVLLALPLLRRWDSWRAAALFFTLLYGAIVRPEAPLMLAWFALVLAAWRWRAILRVARDARDRVRARPFSSTVLAGGAAAAALLGLAIWVLARLVAAGFFDNLRVALGYLARGRPIPDDFAVPMTGPSPNWGDYALRYEWDSFTQYHLHLFLVVGLLGVALRIVNPRRAGKVALLVVPYLLMILLPPVTTFHPWYMRRLWVAVVPLVFLLAGVAMDPKLLAYRWPVTFRRSRRDHPRPSMVVVGAILLIILLLFNLGPAQPIYGEREDDAARSISAQVDAALPDDAIVIANMDATPYAGPLRFLHDRDVVHWFTRQPDSLFLSVAASDDDRPAYLLSADIADVRLEPAPGVAVRTLNWTVPTDVLVRYNLRGYIDTPPLKDGYEPLATYLDGFVPPTEVWHLRIDFTAYELASPAVFQKGVAFDMATWKRTARGFTAGPDGGLLTANASDFANETRQLALYVVYHQAWQGEATLAARTADGAAFNLSEPLRSDGSGSLRMARVPFPPDVTPEEIRLPEGVPLRAAMIGLENYPSQILGAGS